MLWHDVQSVWQKAQDAGEAPFPALQYAVDSVFDARVGDICSVQGNRGEPALLAEVVGFRDRTLLTVPLGDTTGVRPGARMVLRHDAASVPSGRELLGRVIDGFGKPLDGFGPVATTYDPTYRPSSVQDSRPRTISNLISDQSASNPAAVSASTLSNPGAPALGDGSRPIENTAPALGLAAPLAGVFSLEGVRVMTMFDREFVFAGVMARQGREQVLLTGSCEIRESAETAAVLAVLDATNRWMGKAMLSDSPVGTQSSGRRI